MSDNGKIYVEYMALQDLLGRRHPENPKDHNLGRIISSFQEFGYVAPGSIDELTGLFLCGHGRTEALEVMFHDPKLDAPGGIDVREDDWYVPTNRGVTFDSPLKVKAYLVADNELTLLGGWHEPKLATLLQEIGAQDAALLETVYTGDKLDELLRDLQMQDEPPEDKGAQIDRASELQEKWKVQRGDVFVIPSVSGDGFHRILCGDSTNADDIALLMDGRKADLVLTDPPYGIGLDEWDKPIDIALFLSVAIGVMKRNSFLFFFCQMPTMLDWLNAVQATELTYKDHIAWVKRKPTGVTQELLRAHENVFVYRRGSRKYFQTKGAYSDVKLPGLLVDTITIDGIDRYIKDLQIKARGETPSMKKAGSPHNSAYTYMGVGADRSPEYVNFTNVWSFLSETTITLTGIGEHATMKPVKLMARACGLCAPKNGLILDPFLGSGTTIIAAETTRRIGYGMELHEPFVSVCLERLSDLGLTPERQS